VSGRGLKHRLDVRPSRRIPSPARERAWIDTLFFPLHSANAKSPARERAWIETI